MNKEKNNKTEKNNTNMENKYNFSDKVEFHPWVRDKYEYGIKGFDENGIIVYGTKEDPGKKILIVGESHYCAKKEDAIPSITINTIEDLIDPNSEWEPYKNTYTKFIKSFTGYTDDLEFEDKKNAWEHLAFYNYVQETMTGPRISPTTEDFKKSEEAFWKVLNELKPDLIIVWGKRLYNNLPQEGDKLDDFTIQNEYGDDILVEVWSYKINGKDIPIPIIGINHPSSGFDIELWYEAIYIFIENYSNKAKKPKKRPKYDEVFKIKIDELNDALSYYYDPIKAKCIKDKIKEHLKACPNDTSFSIDVENKKIPISFDSNKDKLIKIGDISFNDLKFKRALFLWTWIDIKTIWETLKDKSFHQRKFSKSNDFIKYIANIFYVKAFYRYKFLSRPKCKSIKNKPFSTIKTAITANNSHFKLITKKTEKDEETYIIMDSLLIYNNERVFCIFKEDKNPNPKRPYNLDTICTPNEIIYPQNSNTELKNYIEKEEDYPQRAIQVTNDKTLIAFGEHNFCINFEEFWGHIIKDDDHENRIKDIKNIKNIVDEKNIIVKFKKIIKEKIKEKINDEINLQQKINKRIFPNDAFIYIENMSTDFFPETLLSCFLEFEFRDEKYYLVFSITDNGQLNDTKYDFNLKTLYTKEMYENRIKME